MNENIKILVVEDDRAVRNLISTTLQINDYEYDLAIDGKNALQLMTSNKYDIVFIDLGLPDIDGIEIIKKFRDFSTTPIIVISARTHDEDKIEALDAGADDFLTKPFNVDELLARVRSTLRRINYAENNSVEDKISFENGDIRIDYPSRSVFIKGEEIHLMPIEYSLLCLLAENVGKVLTHQYILKNIWVNYLASDLSSLRVYMTSLRKKIEKLTDDKYIQTHVGVGYKMIRINKSGEDEINGFN
ncbi:MULTISPECIES: response regulator transcription factor [Peptoniphilus]|uniref:Two-component system KDP operon response regulator KdpE n=1 Tax=Peptoniphilus gorbachii TaxID=411567 RepID=A0ABS2MJQ6_9FIRM|nr:MULTISPECIES: response regulator transcription factor [Peptoniphilus]MBM7550251.1 two-component system KDP operon response regulator KdpE [Peptoniphilus gorbachii]MDU1582971.1 response regulator transcription factor [Peptoniphilus harei]MDU1663888.1 response regulator transcription factor [Peptoniphilus harei]